MLASIGNPLAIDLVSNFFEKGMHVKKSSFQNDGAMQFAIPPGLYSPPFSELGKKKKIRDIPLSNFDLENRCKEPAISPKGIFSRSQSMP